MRRYLRPASVTAVAVLTLALAGCSGADEPEAAPTPTESEESTPPEASPPPDLDFVEGEPNEIGGFATRFDKSSETLFPETGVAAVGVSDDLVLTAGGTQVLARTLPDLADAFAVDSLAGSYVDLLVDRDEDLAYTLSQATEEGTGTSVGTEEYAVQRVDLASGEVTGSASIVVPQDNSGKGVPRIGWLVGHEDDTVVVGMRGEGEETARTTAAMNLESGVADWVRDLANPLLADDDVVVVNTGTTAEPGPVLGLDLATGKPRWRSLLFTQTASLVGVEDDAALLATTDGYFNLTAVSSLSLKTGKPVKGVQAREVDSSDLDCRDADDGVWVCLDPGGQVIAWDLARNRPAWTLPSKERVAPTVTNVAPGLVYGVLGNNVAVVLDAQTGEDVVTVAGVAPLDVNEYGGVYTFISQALFAPVMSE